MIGWPVCDYSGVIRREVVVISNSSPSATKIPMLESRDTRKWMWQCTSRLES